MLAPDEIRGYFVAVETNPRRGDTKGGRKNIAMSHTHTMLLYHIVFSTKHREPWLEPNVRESLFPYMSGILKNHNGHALLVNGMPDHVHILAQLRSTPSLADVVQATKAGSSAWFKETFRRSAFSWQEGYGAFSVSVSQCERVRKYIERQEEHHRAQKFEDEYIGLLKRHHIEYDLRFVFD